MLLINYALGLMVCVVVPLLSALVKSKQIIIRNYFNLWKYGISLKRIKRGSRNNL